MRIETLKIRNFKVFRDIELTDLPACCVFLGKNGSGKTTLFRIFAFLKECLATNVRTALNKEGGRNGSLLTLLAEEFIEYAKKGGQVFVSTHSPQFLNAIGLESLFLIEKENGTSSIFRLQQNPLIREQTESGWKAGTLWEQGHMVGVKHRTTSQYLREPISQLPIARVHD